MQRRKNSATNCDQNPKESLVVAAVLIAGGLLYKFVVPPPPPTEIKPPAPEPVLPEARVVE